MDGLRGKLPSLAGTSFNGLTVAAADDFSYTDPVDGSVSQHQGIRVLFEGGARVGFRLSGPGTSGATLRAYIVRFEADTARPERETQGALVGLRGAVDEIAGNEKHTGRSKPSVIT